jgi:hypothetical protein
MPRDFALDALSSARLLSAQREGRGEEVARLSRNHAVEKGVNHGCTRIDTDKTGFGRNQLTGLINRRGAEAQRMQKKKTSSFLVPDFLLTSPLRPRTSRLSVVSINRSGLG